MLGLLSVVTVHASVGPPYVESSPAIQITTMAEPILPERFDLVATAFAVPETDLSITLTLHTTQFPIDAKLAYQAPGSTFWQRLPMRVDERNQKWHVSNAPAGNYAVITVTTATALPGNAIIIDDLDPGFQPYGPEGNWHLVSGPNPTDYYLSHARWTSNTYSIVENWVNWQPTTELTGSHEVYAFIPGNHADTTNARYRIQHTGQESWGAVNQATKWAEWVSLGVYTFTSGTESYVTLTDVTYEGYGQYMVAFDAVAFVPQSSQIYLPLVLRNYPPPHLLKNRTGIHLGSRSDAWPANTLTHINGDPEVGGIWPRAIVVLSDQLYVLDRYPQDQEDGLCRIAQARVRLEELFTYLTEAQQHGVKIIIRIEPSPGNFQDWHELSLPHILLTDETPAGGDYCDWKYGQFRAIDDVATEMHEIYKLNVTQRGWDPAQFFFEPANEPNNEWYSYWEDKEARDRLMTPNAWYEMNSYFSSLYDYAKNLQPNLQILTPPMAQGNLAETKQFGTCKPMTITENLSGYDYMQSTYTSKNDGYSWHNYWRAGGEVWDSLPCPSEQDTPTSQHIIQYFPYWMQATIFSTDTPTFITEADLLSPCQDSANSITDKDTQAEATRESLRLFVAEEQGANYVVAWLLTEYPYSIVEKCPTGLVNNEEIRWHQAYENDSERIWFSPWWLGTE